MVWDLVILLMTIWAWRRTNASKSGLWQLLFRDGLVFFLVSFATNTVPAVRSRPFFSSLHRADWTLPTLGVEYPQPEWYVYRFSTEAVPID